MAKDVSISKQNPAGVLFWAPAGTKLPTSASEALDPAFHPVGDLNEDGVTYSEDNDTTDVQNMDGENVLSINSSHSETIQCVMLETNEQSLKLRFGSTNVTVDQQSGKIHYSTGAPTGEKISLVIDTLLVGNNRKKRTVVESSSLTDVGDRQEHAGDANTYDVTFKAYKNSNGNFTENYIEPLAASPQSAAEPSGH